MNEGAGADTEAGAVRKLRFATFGLTARCNCRCAKCGCWSLTDLPQEMPPETWNRIADDLRSWPGRFEVSVTGGEPTLKEGYLDILRHCSDLGALTILTTNGYALDPETARAIADTGLAVVNVSLDGPPPVNAAIHGVSGITRRAWNGIGVLKDRRPDLFVDVTVVIQRANAAILPDHVAALLGDGRVRVRFQAVVHPVGSPYREGWHLHSDLWPDDPAALAASLDWLVERKRAGAPILTTFRQFEIFREYFADPTARLTLPEGVGEDSLFITLDGWVILPGCEKPVGHAARQSIREIWEGDPARRAREAARAIPRFFQEYVNCGYKE